MKLWLVLGVLGLAVYGSWRGARWYESNYEDPLTSAIDAADFEEARRLVEMGADVNEDGGVPLMFAMLQGNLEFAQYLLDNGADINARQQTRTSHPTFSILEYIAAHRSAEHFDWLLQRGAKYTVVAAALMNDIESVKQALEKNPEILRRVGFPLLHFAVRGGDPELTALLLEAGADDPNTPLLSPFASRAGMKSARELARIWGQQSILDLFDEWNAAKTTEEASSGSIAPDSSALEVPLPEDTDRRSARD